MEDRPKVHIKLALGYALGAVLNVLLLSGALYGLSLVSDPFFFRFSALFLLLVACIGYLVGSLVGRRIDRKNAEKNREVREQLESIQELVKATEFLETEAQDLKTERSALLSALEEAERIGKELQRELTARQKAEAELERTRKNMELILHGGNLGYWDWDVARNHYTFNDRFASITGTKPEDLTHDTDWRSRQVHPEDSQQVNRALSLHLEGKADFYTCEYRLQRGDDEWIWVIDRGRVIERGERKTPLRMVGTLLEITDRKQYELEMKEANHLLDRRSRELEENQNIIMGMMEDANEARESLEQANRQLLIAREKAEAAARTKSEFLASMSHEIRTPMNGIMGTASLLDDTTLSDEQQEYLRIIQTSGDALLSLLNDILDFSKIEAGKLDMDPQPFDLREICEHIMELLAPTALEKGIELVLRFAPSTPPYIVGDAGRVRQVIVNLVGNALKFTHEGYVYLDVEAVAGTERETTIGISVKDTGIGISKEGMPQLFKKFSQGDSSTTREFGGTGLGLAICKQLVELMGGKIGVNSELGKGSLFWFRLSFPIASDQRPATIDKTFFEGEQVLIIDAQKIMGRALKEWMNRWGLQADTVASLDDALTLLKDNEYELVLIEEDLAVETDNPIFNNPALKPFMLFILCSISRRDVHSLDHGGLATNLVKPVRLRNLLKQTSKAQGYTSIPERPEAPARLMEGRPVVVSSTIETVSSYKVLIVEDNLVNQTVAKRMLLKDGFEVDVASNGEEALQKITAEEPFDLIFMDCQMPRMDGYEASRRIRKFEENQGDGRHIPIIAITANAMQGDREKCIDAGMDDYIAKPVKKADMFEMLRRHLD
jgi:PAS domain S-box-containing protein